MSDHHQTPESENEHPAAQLEDRLIDFGVRVIRVAGALPKDDVGRHITRQILRSGTSPAANYAEARSAESRADFIHKLKVVLKELNETRVWLKMILSSELMNVARLQSLITENSELCRLINASITTARANNT